MTWWPPRTRSCLMPVQLPGPGLPPHPLAQHPQPELLSPCLPPMPCWPARPPQETPTQTCPSLLWSSLSAAERAWPESWRAGSCWPPPGSLRTEDPGWGLWVTQAGESWASQHPQGCSVTWTQLTGAHPLPLPGQAHHDASSVASVQAWFQGNWTLLSALSKSDCIRVEERPPQLNALRKESETRFVLH